MLLGPIRIFTALSRYSLRLIRYAFHIGKFKMHGYRGHVLGTGRRRRSDIFVVSTI